MTQFLNPSRDAGQLSASLRKHRLQAGVLESVKIIRQKVAVGGLWKYVAGKPYRVTDKENVALFLDCLEDGVKRHSNLHRSVAMRRYGTRGKIVVTPKEFDAVTTKLGLMNEKDIREKWKVRKVMGEAKMLQGASIGRATIRAKTEARQKEREEIIARNLEIMPDLAHKRRSSKGRGNQYE